MKYWKKKYLGIAASMLINMIRKKCLKNKSYKWEMTVWTAYSSSAVLHLGKNPLRIGDFATFSTPKCFFNQIPICTQTFLSSFQENRPRYILKRQEASQKTYQCVSPCGFARIIF